MALATGEKLITGMGVVDADGRSVITSNASLTASATAGGLTTSHTISAASTNATSVKGTPGQVYGIVVNNINAAVRYLKLYNKASAPTVGTDVPVMTIAIPPAQVVTIQNAMGISFPLGIAFALTTGLPVADTGAVAVSEHAVNLLYK